MLPSERNGLLFIFMKFFKLRLKKAKSVRVTNVQPSCASVGKIEALRWQRGRPAVENTSCCPTQSTSHLGTYKYVSKYKYTDTFREFRQMHWRYSKTNAGRGKHF